jgi:hypothetical protein
VGLYSKINLQLGKVGAEDLSGNYYNEDTEVFKTEHPAIQISNIENPNCTTAKLILSTL